MNEQKAILLGRDGLKRCGIDIPWARDVKGWVVETRGRAQFFLVYLANGVMNAMAGDADEIKRQIADLKKPSE